MVTDSEIQDALTGRKYGIENIEELFPVVANTWSTNQMRNLWDHFFPEPTPIYDSLIRSPKHNWTMLAGPDHYYKVSGLYAFTMPTKEER